MSVFFFLIPVPIPAPLFAVAYLVISTYLMRRGDGQISHEAHLAGALTGLLLAGSLSPDGFGPLIRQIQFLLT
jgi:membrane associated rhomboid family serine protease